MNTDGQTTKHAEYTNGLIGGAGKKRKSRKRDRPLLGSYGPARSGHAESDAAGEKPTLVDRPALADEGLDFGGEGREALFGHEVDVEGPVARGSVVVAAVGPVVGGVLAGEHDDDGAIVGKGSG